MKKRVILFLLGEKKGQNMRLDKFNNDSFKRGRHWIIEAVWVVIQSLLFSTGLPGSHWRCFLLSIFGASIASGVVIKPRVMVKFPWRLHIGSHTWIGEGVWIDNLGNIEIGSNCCVSQGAYFCTGSHDWSKTSFDLIVKPITVKDYAWVAAKAVVAPGVIVGEGAVLGLGSVAVNDLQPWSIYMGNPAILKGPRPKSD